jgi:hypothetical protein
MTDALATVATHPPATFAAQAHIKFQSKSKLTLCLVLTHTYTFNRIYALTLNYSGTKYPRSNSRVTIS